GTVAPRQATLPDFAIDAYEVSNWHYRQCVAAYVCGRTPDEAYNRDDLTKYPVVYVNAQQAATYCRWMGRRLPREIEWEWAARGAEARPWPWGTAPPDYTRMNVDFPPLGDGALEPVDSHPDGRTPGPLGVFNLAGNVMEWTATEYLEYADVRYD